jgi:hypothetical protein
MLWAAVGGLDPRICKLGADAPPTPAPEDRLAEERLGKREGSEALVTKCQAHH